MSEFPKIQKDHDKVVKDNRVDEELFVFNLWLDSVKKGLKRRSYKIPSKILELPCGCRRDRSFEIDISNIWYVGRNKNGGYFHTQCKKEL